MRKNKFVALFLGWLVPGLGHWYAGQRWRAVILFVAITGAAATGLALGSFRSVYFAWNHYQFYAETGNGLFTIVASIFMRITGAAPIEQTASGGTLAGVLPVADLYLMVAGLLNFVCAAGAFDAAAQAGHPATGEKS